MQPHPTLAFDLTRNGRPTVSGGHYAVWDVLELLASGRPEAEWQAEYSDLTAADVRACLLYAAERCQPHGPVTTSANGRTAAEWEAGRIGQWMSPKELKAYLISIGKLPPDAEPATD